MKWPFIEFLKPKPRFIRPVQVEPEPKVRKIKGYLDVAECCFKVIPNEPFSLDLIRPQE